MYVLLTLPSIMLFLPSVPTSLVFCCDPSSSISPVRLCIGLFSLAAVDDRRMSWLMYTDFQGGYSRQLDSPVYLTSKTVNNTSSSPKGTYSTHTSSLVLEVITV